MKRTIDNDEMMTFTLWSYYHNKNRITFFRQSVVGSPRISSPGFQTYLFKWLPLSRWEQCSPKANCCFVSMYCRNNNAHKCKKGCCLKVGRYVKHQDPEIALRMSKTSIQMNRCSSKTVGRTLTNSRRILQFRVTFSNAMGCYQQVGAPCRV